jgi:C_GCAxxG_C_C family probable redox protein
MESRVNETIRRHDKGFNCAQSVACTYCDLVGMSEEDAFRAMEGFGLGMGCMEGTCGALSGAVMLAGLKGSCADLETPKSKGATYKVAARIVRDFKEKAGATACKDLKGVETGKMLYSCPDCIKTAAALAEEILFTEEK